MADTNPQATLDTNSPELRLNRLEADWRCGGSPPDWRQHLPAETESCSPQLIYDLLQMDIEYRIKAGLPALLSEHYFEHPRLQHVDARLNDAQQVELIQWEYLQRLNRGEQPRRAQYEAAFPQHLEALRKMKPRSRCPRCQKTLILEETFQTLLCPDCGVETHMLAITPSSAADTVSLTELDLRSYQLVETVGKGGMGEVYCCCDPALGRDLAIKVMKAEYRGIAEAERRFLREARVTGSLQHPGIVPVHNLGRLADGRLHYTMRLVRGQTLAAILEKDAGKPECLPHLLTIFEKICQAVAYAHSKHVIHRDLKPQNVMVGPFGEVQVMDWGLAKVLTATDAAEAGEESIEIEGVRIHTEAADTPLALTRLGHEMGTLGYMPSEQALGQWGTVDERADVFALGSILCEMLTGKPAYTGTDSEEVCRRVKRGDVTEALERLQQCGADAALMALCRECLSSNCEDRPRDADAVSKRVGEYQAEVQERLRQAELERVAAQTRAREEQARAIVEQERTKEAVARATAEAERAQEAQARARAERRAKRRMLVLSAAVFVILFGGAGFGWRLQRERVAVQARQYRADEDTKAALERAGDRLEEARRLNDMVKLSEAKAEVDRATAIARSGGASDEMKKVVAIFQKEAQKRFHDIEQNNDLLGALLDIATPHEATTYVPAGSGQRMAAAEPSVEEQYTAAFRRRWPDVDLDKQVASEVASRLREEPETVIQGVIAGLDGWMVERQRQQRPEVEWRRLLAVVEQLDHSESRRQLRSLLTGDAPPSGASVVGLLAGRPPWPALWELAQGDHGRRLRQLRRQMKVEDEPVLTVLLLAQASSAVGDMVGAEEVLRLALARHPDEISLLDALGDVQVRQGRLTEAIGCYRAARAKNPGLGVALYFALRESGQVVEGLAILRDLVRRKQKDLQLQSFVANELNNYSLRLSNQEKYDKVEQTKETQKKPIASQ